ncbi:MAG: DUF971 family protein, partial [Halioglobus sp.]
MSRQHLTPVEVLLNNSTSSLEITWSDGEKSDLSGASLRRYCA